MLSFAQIEAAALAGLSKELTEMKSIKFFLTIIKFCHLLKVVLSTTAAIDYTFKQANVDK